MSHDAAENVQGPLTSGATDSASTALHGDSGRLSDAIVAAVLAVTPRSVNGLVLAGAVHYEMDGRAFSGTENKIDVYPVGMFLDVKNRRLRRGLRSFADKVRHGNWRDAKNWLNGYLAEPTPFPAGVRRCGSGWTRQRALRSLERQIRKAVR